MNSWSADRGIWYLVRRLFSNSVVSLGSNSTIVLDVESQRLAVVRSCCRACIRYSRSAWTHRAGKVWLVFTNLSWIVFISKINYQTKPTSKTSPLRDIETGRVSSAHNTFRKFTAGIYYPYFSGVRREQAGSPRASGNKIFYR